MFSAPKTFLVYSRGERQRKNKLPMKVEDRKSWDQQSGECEQPWVPGDGCEESRAFTGQALAHGAHTHCKSAIAHQGVGARAGFQVWLLFPFKLCSVQTVRPGSLCFLLLDS